VGTPAYPPDGLSFLQNPLIRKFDLADRDRRKADASLELMTPIEGLVVTPMASWRDDDFKDGTATDEYLGLKKDTVWNAGVEVAYAQSSTVTFFAGYVHEEFKRTLANQDSSACIAAVRPVADCNWGSKIDDVINTVYAAANIELVPDSLFLKMWYIFSYSVGKTNTYALGATGITSTPQFPDVATNFHRLDAVLNYKIDPDLVHRLAWSATSSQVWAIHSSTIACRTGSSTIWYLT
jgi:hypothetical protein